MSNVKKLVTIVLLVVLMAIVLPFGFSKAETKATFTTTTTSGERGKTVTVKLDVNNDLSVSGMTVGFSFDKDVFEVKSITDGTYSLVPGAFAENTGVDMANQNGYVKATFGSASDKKISAGTILTVELKIKENARGGDYTLTTIIDKIVNTVNVSDEINNTNNYAKENGKVTVKVPVKSISLNESTLNLTRGVSPTGQLKATVDPDLSELYPAQSISWMTEENKVATVSGYGDTATVTAVGNGETTITATIGGKYAICTVKVTTPLKGISLDRQNVDLTKGQTDTLKYTLNPTDAFPVPTVTWESDKPNVVSVNNGEIKALGTGGQQATITVKADGYSATCVVTVKEIPLNSIEINKADFELNLGDSETLGVLYNPENTTDELGKVKWTSNKPDVVKVDEDGKVTAVGVGEAVITAEVNGKTATVTITVPEINITGVKLTAEKTTIKVDGTTKLSFKTIPEEVTDEITEVKYVSEDDEIATVDENGVVTGHKAGKVKIKVIVNGEFTDEIEIEVVEKAAVLPDEEDNTTNETTGGSSTTTPTDQTGNTTGATNTATTTNTNTETSPDLPKTGDMLVLFIVLVVGSLSGIVLVVRKKLKK